MIDFIEGKVASKAPGELVMNAGGVGFLLLCSSATLGAAPGEGESWRCYTVMNVREDAIELYGFVNRQERALFRRLLAVTGIGAKTALSVLSSLSVHDLSVAILSGDVTALSRVPGIGKKTAQRIVLELKDKIGQQEVSLQESAAPVNGAAREAQAALQALGYTSAEAARAINLVRDKAETVDQMVMMALRQMDSL